MNGNRFWPFPSESDSVLCPVGVLDRDRGLPTAGGRRIVIVGGVAGGATAATRLRRLDEYAEIILLERGDTISHATCGLPYYLGGVIERRESLLLQNPDSLRRRYRIDVRVRHEVLRILRDAREVEVRNLQSGEIYHLGYDHLILATGAAPVRPSIPGADLDRVFTLRSLPDIDRIMRAATASPGGRAAVVGGGFIGLEMAENLARRGLQVTLIEAADQVLPPLDREMAALVHNHLRQNGIDLRLRETVTAFEPGDKGSLVLCLRSGAILSADLAILAVGIRPEVQLAAEAGLALGPRGGVLVDENLRTSDPHISAVGDVAEVPGLQGGTAWVPLAGPASRQARLTADRLGGLPVRYRGAQGTGIVQILGLTAAFTGRNEAALRNQGLPFHSVIITANSHVGYYPGACPITLKLHFAPDGKILGAQAVGADGVDKRMDVLATALRLGATVDDLADLELCYAPPYSSPKDPVNILGYVAGNVLRGERMVDWRQVMSRDPASTVLLDVREESERQADRIEGSIHIPLNQLRERLSELPRDREIIVYCAVGLRGHIALRILEQNGFRVANLSGGLRIYAAVREDMKHTDPAVGYCM
ncbi:MAG TPA: FAD-dependent oxidoreductase [Symbiobacteriaceae bacterium]